MQHIVHKNVSDLHIKCKRSNKIMQVTDTKTASHQQKLKAIEQNKNASYRHIKCKLSNKIMQVIVKKYKSLEQKI